MTVGPDGAKRIGSAGWASSDFQLLLDEFQDRVHFHDPIVIIGTNFIGQFLCGSHAHVGLDERFEEFLEKRLVDQPARAFKDVADVGIQQLGGLSQSLLEFIEKTHG